MGRLSWSLADPELDLLGRVGLAAIALALDAAKETGHDLKPLEGRFDATNLELAWPDDVSDQGALSPLIEWAWQTRGAPAGQDPGEGMGILYLPGVHRGDARDDSTQRLVEHSGILSTFVQHPNTQPKTKPKTLEARTDERVIQLRYVEPKKRLAYVNEFSKKLFLREALRNGRVSFSSFLRPGATARYRGEDSWAGSAVEAIPLLCAPTTCFYLQLRGKDWVVVAPDPGNLEEFVRLRPAVALSQREARAASEADAAIRVLVAIRTRSAVRQLERQLGATQECMVMRVGAVGWNRQSVRNRAFRLRPTEEMLDAFECLERRLANRLRERAEDGSAFVVVPSPRGVVAENLVDGAYWYRNLFDVPAGLRDQVEKNRRAGESSQRAWFRWVRAYKKEIVALMGDMQKLEPERTRDRDAAFSKAFHSALRSLYGREAAQATRGSRSVTDRLEDRTEKIRRELARAQTRQHVRAALAELFAEAGRSREIQDHGDEIWLFIDDARDWRRARDLSLLCLATYARPEDDEEPTHAQEGEEEV